MIRKIWLFFFLVSVALEICALISQQQYILSALSLSFFYAVYHYCYRQTGTALLTFIIWSYWALIGLFFATCAFLFFVNNLGNTASFLRQMQLTGIFNFSSISVFVISSIYLAANLYLTIRLRRYNRALK